MRAVWSFWSRPHAAYYHRAWGAPLNHLLSWVVSVHAAAAHYADTLLVTDTPGKRLLVDRLGLPFAAVSTDLDRLATAEPGFWALGKLHAYAAQDRPFVHIDADAYLWRRLPETVEQAPVLAQHPEWHSLGGTDYRPGDIEAALAATGGQPLPDEWRWARSQGPDLAAENCGIVGGRDVAFLRHYAKTAIAIIERPENAAAWRRLPDKWCHNMVLEQFFLSACLGFHRHHPRSPFRGVRAAYLFQSWGEALDAGAAARVGFTHLMAGSKATPEAGRRLAARVRRDHPAYYDRCVRLAQEQA